MATHAQHALDDRAHARRCVEDDEVASIGRPRHELEQSGRLSHKPLKDGVIAALGARSGDGDAKPWQTRWEHDVVHLACARQKVPDAGKVAVVADAEAMAHRPLWIQIDEQRLET